MKEKPTLADIPGVLPKTVLLILRAWGNTKAPADPSWNNLTYEQTCEPAYQQRLKGTRNIGVKLGADSNNLCSVDFDTEVFLEWFLENNPDLANSFRVRGAKGGQIYFYFEGERPDKACFLTVPEGHFLAVGAKKEPKNGRVKIGEFRAEGGQSVLVGKHPDSTAETPIWYSWPVDNPPLTITFDQINWHPDIEVPWSKGAAKRPAHSSNNGGRNGDHNHETDTEAERNKKILEADKIVSIDFLWEYFEFPERKKKKNGGYVNPVSSPFRDDDNDPSFSAFMGKAGEQRFYDHGIGDKGGDSFDFYQLATGTDSHTGFLPFMRLAEALKNGEEIPPYSADSSGSTGSTDSTGSADSGESEEEALEKETRRVEEWYGKKTTSTSAPIREEAFIGFAGKWVAIATAQTECNPDNLLAHFLVCVGVLFGRYFYTFLGQNLFANEFLTVLGDSASGRKGTALFEVQRFMTLVDPGWNYKVRKSIQSGEAIIHFTRDRVEGLSRGKTPVMVVKDEGVADKRLLIVESELYQFFKVSDRNGNTLTAKLREAYDCPDLLQTSNKNSPETATNPYVSMIGHITEAELKTTNPANIVNGYINRNIYAYAFRAREIPDPEPIEWPEEMITELAETIRLAQAPTDISVGDLGLDRPAPIKRILLDEEAKLLWQKIHAEDTTENGPMSAILERRLSHILKCAQKYARLDRSPVITSAHLLAGVAIMDHSDALASSVFSDFTPNKLANKTLTALNRESPKGLTKTQIWDDVARGNASKSEMNEALAFLFKNKLAYVILKKFNPDAKKPTEVWFAGQKTANKY